MDTCHKDRQLKYKMRLYTNITAHKEQHTKQDSIIYSDVVTGE